MGLLLSPGQYEFIWQRIDVLTMSKLSTSQFHTVERDYILSLNIFRNIFTLSFLSLLALSALYYKRLIIVALIIGLDMIVNTQGMVIFCTAFSLPKLGRDETDKDSVARKVERSQLPDINQKYERALH
jgi:hypothetical protein